MYYNYSYRLKPENDANKELFNVDKGFINGTMFADIYDGYKNYVPTAITPTTEKKALLMDVQKYMAAIIDLALYMDTHPNDEKIALIYSECVKRLKAAVENYEKMYGPLCLTSEYLEGTPWGWTATCFPWEECK